MSLLFDYMCMRLPFFLFCLELEPSLATGLFYLAADPPMHVTGQTPARTGRVRSI